MERLLLSFQFCAQNIMNNSVLKLGHFKGQKTVSCSSRLFSNQDSLFGSGGGHMLNRQQLQLQRSYLRPKAGRNVRSFGMKDPVLSHKIIFF